MATEQNKPRTTGLKIISVALAVLLWFYVMSQGQLSARQNVMDVELQYALLRRTGCGRACHRFRSIMGCFREPDQIKPSWIRPAWEGTHNLPVR